MKDSVIADVIILPDSIRLVAGFITALIVTYISVPTIVRISDYKQLYALPNDRTSHTKKLPTLGGLAVFAGFTLAIIFFSHRDIVSDMAYILGALIPLFFVGIKDDILVIDPKKKFFGQFLASLIVVWLGGFYLSDLHQAFGIGKIPYMASVIFTLFVFLVIINGFNLIDGIDGLASAIGILASVFYGIWFIISGNINFGIFAFSLTGALLAFFWYNVFGKENKIFLGDTGSMIIGFIIAVLTVEFLETNLTVPAEIKLNSAPAISISLLILPLFDTLRVFTLRLRNGKSPFKADHNHIHHILLTFGFSHMHVTIILLLVNIFFLFVALLFQDVGCVEITLLMLILMAVFTFILYFLARRRKRHACLFI